MTHAAASEDIPKQIEAAIASAPKGKKPRVILEGFPTTIEQSDRFERDVSPALRTIRRLSARRARNWSRLSPTRDALMLTQVGPILVVLFIDLEAEKALARLEQRDKSIQNDARINWKRFEDKSRAIVKRFRDEGNILEVRLRSIALPRSAKLAGLRCEHAHPDNGRLRANGQRTRSGSRWRRSLRAHWSSTLVESCEGRGVGRCAGQRYQVSSESRPTVFLKVAFVEGLRPSNVAKSLYYQK